MDGLLRRRVAGTDNRSPRIAKKKKNEEASPLRVKYGDMAERTREKHSRLGISVYVGLNETFLGVMPSVKDPATVENPEKSGCVGNPGNGVVLGWPCIDSIPSIEMVLAVMISHPGWV